MNKRLIIFLFVINILLLACNDQESIESAILHKDSLYSTSDITQNKLEFENNINDLSKKLGFVELDSTLFLDIENIDDGFYFIDWGIKNKTKYRSEDSIFLGYNTHKHKLMSNDSVIIIDVHCGMKFHDALIFDLYSNKVINFQTTLAYDLENNILACLTFDSDFIIEIVNFLNNEKQEFLFNDYCDVSDPVFAIRNAYFQGGKFYLEYCSSKWSKENQEYFKKEYVVNI